MKRTLILITIVSASLGFSLCSAGEIPEDVLVKLDRIGAEMERAALVNDYKSLLDYYTEDVIIMADFQAPVKGKKTLKSLYEKEADQRLKYHSINGLPEKRWESDGLIYEYGSFGMTVSSKSDDKPKGYYGSYFQIWEPSGSSYRLKYVIWNLDHYPC